MKILVLNCGSSSLKYQLIDLTSEEILAKGVIERIGLTDAQLIHYRYDQKFIVAEDQQINYGGIINNHQSAVNCVLTVLTALDLGVIDNLTQIEAVGHRVVHGGEKYANSVLINDTVIADLEYYSKLAPLHNPANIIGIKSCLALLKTTPMVAVFDTAFHQTMPPEAYVYSLPYNLYQQYAIRRYGFHGTSHKYVAQQAAKFLNRDLKQLKLISCHLGNGASVAAIKFGHSIDTSMGFTPLAGLTMGTRCGDLDPSILPWLANELNMDFATIDNLLNKQSGILGISGVSSDFRDLAEASTQGNTQAELALNIFSYQVKKYIGAYMAAMNGVDAIIFTAGIGENDIKTRARIISDLECFNIKLDPQRNNVRGKLTLISTDHSLVKVLLVPTNEELMIATETKLIIHN
jgi:acetate kinase